MQTETNSIIGQLPPPTQPYWSEDQRLRARWALNVVSILGVQTACANVPKILRLVKLWVNQRQKRTIFYVNAHCLNVANSDAAYFTILNQASLVYADGIGIIWANRFLHGAQSEMAKATGADWIEQFCTLAEMQKWRIYILAEDMVLQPKHAANCSRNGPVCRSLGFATVSFWKKVRCKFFKKSKPQRLM